MSNNKILLTKKKYSEDRKTCKKVLGTVLQKNKNIVLFEKYILLETVNMVP